GEEGLVDAPIGGSRDTMPGFAVRPDGRTAQTRFRTIERLGAYTMVELEPLTGRTNQLRIHCAYAGAPIAGDDLHGLPEAARFFDANPRAPLAPRLCLHAFALSFDHPFTREPISLTAPLAPEIVEFLRIV